jgi:hypothetical protein
MSQITPQILNFARHLIAHETGGIKSSETKTPNACYVCERLGPHLTNLMGTLGFRALLARSLALAAVEVPWLLTVQIAANGSFEGFNAIRAQLDPNEVLKGCVVVLAHFLRLLLALVGEDLTLQLLREVWPKLPSSENLNFIGDDKK